MTIISWNFQLVTPTLYILRTRGKVDSKERARWVSTCTACNTSAIFLFMCRVGVWGEVGRGRKQEAGSGQRDSPGMDIFKDHCLAV